MKLTVVAASIGAFLVAGFASSAAYAAPSAWTCSASYYAASDGCDCNCGVYDPDCGLSGQTLYGCSSGQTCSSSGVCTSGSSGGVPSSWTCSPSYYAASDGCDCNCGAYDPDCGLSGQALFGCSSGQTCSSTGTCSGGSTTPPPSGAPSGWTCSASYYNAADGCDCNCGVYDPDCSLSGQTLYGCSTGQTCSSSGVCQSPAPPAGGTFVLHFGGMCSQHWAEGNAAGGPAFVNRSGATNIDVYNDMSTNIQSRLTTVQSYLDGYCSGGKLCYIINYSAGDAAILYTLAHTSNASGRWPGIISIHTLAGASGGSDLGDLASWTGDLASWAACPMAGTLGKSELRSLVGNHGIVGSMGLTDYRHGGIGHAWYAPWDWSSIALYAGSAVCSGEDDGAVGMDSSGGCVSSSGRDDMCCTHFSGHTPWGSCTSTPEVDHYEMKWRFSSTGIYN